MLIQSLRHDAAPPLQSLRHEARVTRFGRIFLWVFLVTVLEGAARKWISNSLSMPLVLSRDMLVLYGIYHAARHCGFTVARQEVKLLLFWSVIVLAWGLLQLTQGRGTPQTLLIGLRFWLLYLWFAVAASRVLTEHDVQLICRVTLVLMVLMAPLVVVQQHLPAGNFLNRQTEGDESQVFMMTGDLVRATGTFSFTTGYTTFLGISAPIALQYVLGPGGGRTRYRMLSLLVLAALAVSSLTSGSREAVILLPILIVTAIGCSVVFGRGVTRLRAVYWAAMMVPIGVITAIVLSASVQGLTQRFDEASESENFNDRVEAMFLGESNGYSRQGLLGEGIGRASNLASYVERGEIAFAYAETETSRTIVEGGLLGYTFVFLKFALCVAGMWRAFGLARRTGSSFAVLLWLVASICLLSWAMIGQLTINALGFLYVGLTMAVTRLGYARLRSGRRPFLGPTGQEDPCR